MRPVLIALLTAGVSLGPAVRAARAVTADDLVNLSAHGLSEEVLVALIETDGSRFSLAPEDVLSLKTRGLNDAVILAMIRTTPPADSSPTFQAPVASDSPTVIERVVEAPPVVTTVFVPVPVVFSAPARIVDRPKEAPVYWGFGGQLRPDAWQPTVKDSPKDSAKAPASPTPATSH
jgi:hypothetical protein